MDTYTLKDMAIDTYSYITHIDYSDVTLVRRLAALGIRVGARVYIVRKALLGSPIQLRVGTTSIAIAAGPAAHIHVRAQ